MVAAQGRCARHRPALRRALIIQALARRPDDRAHARPRGFTEAIGSWLYAASWSRYPRPLASGMSSPPCAAGPTAPSRAAALHVECVDPRRLAFGHALAGQRAIPFGAIS